MEDEKSTILLAGAGGARETRLEASVSEVLQFDITIEEFVFQCCPKIGGQDSTNQNFLIALSEFQFLFLELQHIVTGQRVQFGIKNFDMAIIFGLPHVRAHQLNPNRKH